MDKESRFNPEKEIFLGFKLGEKIVYRDQNGWEICAFDKTPGSAKPLGIIRSEGYPAHPTWIAVEDIQNNNILPKK